METLSPNGKSFSSSKEDDEKLKQFDKFDKDRHGGPSTAYLYQLETDRMKYYYGATLLIWICAGMLWMRRNRKRPQKDSSNSQSPASAT
jgi:hypothetical protein